ncbi:MAG: YchF/TatD family DNA exonuclease [Nitrospirota bacterium]|nr:YchF/TatD family DNA exonuclease [Nitrospirota bacterium]MDH5767583.1 YchF/TatD family DNA exonuclease [Nitrospirota bacterium]
MLSSAISYQPSAINLIDTHCHLEMDEFNPDRKEVIQRAKAAGIEAIITIGSDLEGNVGGLELSKKYDFIYSSVGFHPHDAKDFTEDIFNQIKSWIKNSDMGQGIQGKIVAIGEIGLDYHYDNSPREIQRDVFMRQLQLAKEVNLPVVIHSREARKDTLEIIRESGVDKGVLHCFSGDREMAEKAMAMGFYISFAGPVTFRNAKKPKEIVKAIPDDYLLIETDAPYLSPEPFRGKRNEPSYLIHTARAIAEMRGITIEDLARITTLNAKRLFKIGQLPERGVIAYKIRDNLYLNITNRCTNECSFCIRFHTDYVKGHNLRLSEEPSEEELKDAIGDPSRYREIVFCGYGEPLLRLDLVKSVAGWIKQNNGKVRINTNGHGNLIHGRNILPELKGIVDSISVSLDAQDEETYNRVCKPTFKNAYREILSFIKEAKQFIPHVQITVVELEGVDVEKCKKIAEDLGVGFRIRKLDVVG